MPGRNEPMKLAARVASQIAEDVIARGWPVGEVLGSAADLQLQYDVSRAVFREAVRLLEHQGVVRTQRGATGGLIVAEPSLDAIIDAAVMYLLRLETRVDEIFEARILLEGIVAELASQRIDAEGRRRIDAHLAGEAAGDITDPQAFHALLASIARNPVLELFVRILNSLSLLYLRDKRSVDPATTSWIRRDHERIAKAVRTGDAALAAKHLRRHLEVSADALRRRHATRPMLSSRAALASPQGGKRAETVAREIYHLVAAGRLQPGYFLGSEPTLLEQHGVSRSVLREAVRLLEHHDVAAMRRGTGGGLYVTAPSAAAVTDVVALYLARHGTDIDALADLRGRLEVGIVDLVVDRLDEDGAALLDEAAELDEGDEGADVAIHNLHVAMATLADNRAIELVTLVLIRLTRFRQSRPLSARARHDISAEVHRAHVAIARAVRNGDREVARRRMRRHLDALAAFLR